MRTNRTLFSAALLALGLCVFAPGVHAQRWYSEERDQKAREAAKLAEEITNKSSFEAQLRNLDKFAERDFEVYFTGAERQMELDLHTVRTWGSVFKIVNRTKETLRSSTFLKTEDVNTIVADLGKECPLRTTELGKSVCDAKAALQKLKDAHAKADAANEDLDEELKSRLENIDAIDSIVNQATAFLMSDPAKSKTIKALSEAFAGLAKSFLTFNTRLKQINQEPQDDLKLLLQRIAVETLQLEVDHWKTLSEINIRRSAEETDLNFLAEDVELRLLHIAQCFEMTPQALAQQEIRATLADTVTKDSCIIVDSQTGQPTTLSKQKIATNIYQTLHNVSALVARGNTPFKLAELRQAHELHRFSIRKSLIVARGYELVLRTGTDRLSRYYAGGLKPQQIAQLVYSAATLAIPGVIAGN